MTEEARAELDIGSDWTRRWTAVWKYTGQKITSTVHGLVSMPARGCEPVRAFNFSFAQPSRAGVEFLLSTGRRHGYESLEELMLLHALDFAGDLDEVQSQPMRLRFSTTSGQQEHIPDYLAYTAAGMVLFDVRPAALIRDKDRVKFAAAAEVAFALGWRYAVVAGWRPHVVANLSEMRARYRPMTDPLGMSDQVLAQLRSVPRRFDEIVEATSVPAIARTHLTHLLWHRRAVIDMSQPLGDASLVWAAGVGSC